jgi:hypothetical protein
MRKLLGAGALVALVLLVPMATSSAGAKAKPTTTTAATTTTTAPPVGVTGYEIVHTTSDVVVDAGQMNYGDFDTACASRNKRPVGGGGFLALPGATGETPNPAPGWSAGASYPFRSAEGSFEAWVVNFVRDPGGPAASYTLHLWVACIPATS